MALHPDFPDSPHAILDPEVRWFPADEAMREMTMDKLMPPLVAQLRRKVKEFRDSGYVGASGTSKSLLTWWFKELHLLPKADGSMFDFRYYFAQREAIETIVYLSISMTWWGQRTNTTCCALIPAARCRRGCSTRLGGAM
jgi:type III restriction enzyme